MKTTISILLPFLLTGCSDEMPDLAGDYLLKSRCDEDTLLGHVLTLNSEYLPNVGYKYSIAFPKGSSILPAGHPNRSYRSKTLENGVTAKFYRPSSHTGDDGFETDLTLSHLPNGDILLQQWNIKSWHHTTRKVTDQQLESIASLTPHIGKTDNGEGELVTGVCLRPQANA